VSDRLVPPEGTVFFTEGSKEDIFPIKASGTESGVLQDSLQPSTKGVREENFSSHGVEMNIYLFIYLLFIY